MNLPFRSAFTEGIYYVYPFPLNIKSKVCSEKFKCTAVGERALAKGFALRRSRWTFQECFGAISGAQFYDISAILCARIRAAAYIIDLYRYFK